MDNMEQYDCFISHSSKNTTNAKYLVSRLEAEGIKCWVAPRDIRAGAAYAAEIVAGIESSELFIVLISEESLASRHVEREVNIADNLKKSIYPVKLIDIEIYGGLSFYLSVSQEIRLFEETSDPVEKLISSIKDGVVSVKTNNERDASFESVINTQPTESVPTADARRGESNQSLLIESELDIDTVPSKHDRLSLGAVSTVLKHKYLMASLCLMVFVGSVYFFAADKVEDESVDNTESKVPDTQLADQILQPDGQSPATVQESALQKTERLDRLLRRKSQLTEQYKMSIRRAVARNFRRPASVSPDASCTAKVRLVYPNQIVDVEVTDCSGGDTTLTQAIEEAIYSTDPFPHPPHKAVFERRLVFQFNLGE